jgi:hypothetical protein
MIAPSSIRSGKQPDSVKKGWAQIGEVVGIPFDLTILLTSFIVLFMPDQA